MSGARRKPKTVAKTSRARVSQKEIGELQKRLAKLLLTGQLHFPDAAFLQRQPAVLIDDENVARSLSPGGLPKPLRVLSRDTIQGEARAQGDLAYLHFQPPTVKGNEVQFTLQAKIAPRDGAQRTMGLSTVQVTFRRVGKRWDLVGQPVLSAS
jgi:hypothetical protein